jgi:hypothetical protein
MGFVRSRTARTRPLSAIRSLTGPCIGRRCNAMCSLSGCARLPVEALQTWPEGFLLEVRNPTRGVVPERPVSRVLFRRRVAPASAKIIPLGRPLLGGSSTLTRTPRLDLRPDDRADRSRRCAYSSLLREGLASPPVTRQSRVGSYPTISTLPVSSSSGEARTIGGVFSAALSLGSPRVAVNDLPVLWSPDFPPVNDMCSPATFQPPPAGGCIVSLARAAANAPNPVGHSVRSMSSVLQSR